MLDLIRQRAQSWAVKVAFGIIIIVFVFWGIGASDQGGPGVVATVNGKPILAQDFMHEVDARENQVRAAVPDFSAEDMRALRIPEQSLQILVSRELIRQEAERIGMTVTPVELLQFLRTISVFHGPDGVFDQQVYEQTVAAQGRRITEFEQSLMRDLLGEKMRAHVSAAVTVSPEEARRKAEFLMEKRTASYVLFATGDYREGVAVTDEAIAAYYAANQPRFAVPAATAVSYIEVTPETLAPSMDVADSAVDEAYARGPLRYNLRQILLTVPVGADDAAEKSVREKLEKIAEEIQNGKDFAEAAREFSEDPSGAAGGELGWIPARQLTPEILGAVAGLAQGGVTAPVRTSGGYSLLQVGQTDPDWSLPESEIRAALRGELAKDAAAIAFRDVQNQAEDHMALGKPLADIAAEMRLAVATTKPVPREDLAFLLGLRKSSQTGLFDGEKGSLVSAILETREGFVIAEIAEQKPAGVTPLEEVRDLILDILTRQEAEKKAEQAAREALPAFAKGVPEAYRGKIITSEPFGRRGEVPGLGLAKGLVDAVFASPLEAWIPQPFATPEGVVIAMPVEIVPIAETEWNTMAPTVTASLLEAKRGQVFSAFIADIGRSAKVSITDPAIFEQ